MVRAMASVFSKTVARCSLGKRRSLAGVERCPMSGKSTWPGYTVANFVIMAAAIIRPDGAEHEIRPRSSTIGTP